MIVRITSLSDPGIEIFSSLTEAQLRNRLCPSRGIFIAESPKVILTALAAGYTPCALLCEERHIAGDARDIIARLDDALPIYTGSRELLAALTGYTLTRGVLCAMRRPEATPALAASTGRSADLAAMLADARRIVVIDGVVDATNIGAIFRSAAALGMDAVVLTPNSCDPLNRRAIRVSMGSVFLIPWSVLPPSAAPSPLQPLYDLGFTTAAMALTDDSIPLDDPRLPSIERLAIIMGTEGDGLPLETIRDANFVVRIPMFHQVDSLNVAAASAVAFWQLRAR